MSPAAEVEINVVSSRKEGPGTYHSCPGKGRARALGRVTAAASARTSSTEEAMPAAVGRDQQPSSNVAATTSNSTSLCFPGSPTAQLEPKTAGLPGLWLSSIKQHCQVKLLLLTFSHPQQTSVLPVSKAVPSYVN